MNPYLPPSDAGPPPYTSEERAAVTATTIEMLRQTRPWVQLLGVLALIGAAFMALGGLSIVALAAFAPRAGAGMAGVGLVYLPLAALYIYPGIKLWKYGSAINRLVATHTSDDLEAALAQQKSFWKFAGISALIMVVLYVVVFVAAMAGGILAAGRH